MGEGILGCKDLIGWITLLIALKSSTICLIFFLIIKMGYEMFLYVLLVIAPILRPVLLLISPLLGATDLPILAH
jgi:hypothetical protein